jgi:hypothetical protein
MQDSDENIIAAYGEKQKASREETFIAAAASLAIHAASTVILAALYEITTGDGGLRVSFINSIWALAGGTVDLPSSAHNLSIS